jgi:hypothetical protein
VLPGKPRFSLLGCQFAWEVRSSSERDAQYIGLLIPDWLMMLIASIPITLFVYRPYRRRKLRRKQGLCEHCGYSLQGLPSPRRCPECGNLEAKAAKYFNRSTTEEQKGREIGIEPDA